MNHESAGVSDPPELVLILTNDISLHFTDTTRIRTPLNTFFFSILLTVHLHTILANDQLGEQFLAYYA
jgi:hypothetical protein